MPAKFEVFSGQIEVTDPAQIWVDVSPISCPTAAAAAPVTATTKGKSGLKYDSGEGIFLYRWQTPKAPNTCYRLTVQDAEGTTITLSDGTPLSADFRLN